MDKTTQNKTPKHNYTLYLILRTCYRNNEGLKRNGVKWYCKKNIRKRDLN